jgi:hypothetical protein
MIKIVWLLFALNCDAILLGAMSCVNERRCIVQSTIIIEELLFSVGGNHYHVG